MAQIVSPNIPHIARKIFENVDIFGLIKCLYVSKTWRQLAQEVFENRLNEEDVYGIWNAFQIACRFGHTFAVKIILNSPESKRNMLDLNRKCAYNSRTLEPFVEYIWQSPFMFACEYGHKDVVKLLLDYSGRDDIKFNMETLEQRTAFMLACQKGQLKVVELLLDYSPSKGINLETKDMHGMTPLMLAIENGHNEVFRLLLDNLGIEDYYCFDYDLLRRSYGKTAFTYACKLGQTEMVKEMLDHPQSFKLKINKIVIDGCYGWTQVMDGFMQATIHSQVDVANVLLYHHSTQNLDWNAWPWDGETDSNPLFLRVCEMAHSKEIVKLFLDHPSFNLNVRGQFGKTGFMRACVGPPDRKKEVIQLLMQNSVRCNIDLNARDMWGYTTFMNACFYGRSDVVQILLENAENTHIDFNATDNKGRTALMLACGHEWIEVVIILVDFIKKRFNIQLNIKDNFGATALTLACRSKRTDIVQLLLEAEGAVKAKEEIILETRTNEVDHEMEGTGGAETLEDLCGDLEFMEASDASDDDVESYETDDE